MELHPDLIADSMYDVGGILVDEIIEVDAAKSLVRARMPVNDQLPITREQRVHPVRHPRHVSGGLMVHMTGVIGFLHAYLLLGIRHRDGWVGYGAKIHHAKFHNLAQPPKSMVLSGWATNIRRSADKVYARYRFEFHQGDTLIYDGDQTAVWMKVDDTRATSQG